MKYSVIGLSLKPGVKDIVMIPEGYNQQKSLNHQPNS